MAGESTGKCHFLQQPISNVDHRVHDVNLLGICVTAGAHKFCCDNVGYINWQTLNIWSLGTGNTVIFVKGL